MSQYEGIAGLMAQDPLSPSLPSFQVPMIRKALDFSKGFPDGHWICLILVRMARRSGRDDTSS